MTYFEELPNSKYVPNVVIYIDPIGYFSIRACDSGDPVISERRGLIQSISLNPTSIDPFRATTSISSNSFKIIDKNLVFTNEINNILEYFQGKLVEIYIGRVGVAMDFADYLKIPDSYINKISYADGSYSFSTRESKDRLNKNIYNEQSKLSGDILAATTSIIIENAPINNSGLIKINNELISYASVTGNTLNGCIRGMHGTVPADHSQYDDVYFCEYVTGNPIDIILQLLISGGGGGVYDVLQYGAGIDEALVDVVEFTDLKANYYSGETYTFVLSSIENLKEFIENEILFPTGTRLRSNGSEKIGIGAINKVQINIDDPDLTNDNITKLGSFSVDENKIVNQLKIEWNYSIDLDKFTTISTYTDPASIALYGTKKELNYKFTGITSQDQADNFANDFFLRYSNPKPIIDLNVMMSASNWKLLDKPYVISDKIPSNNGDLNFAQNLEIVSKAINHQTGDVKLQLVFNQFTGQRICFIAPSDAVAGFGMFPINNEITVGAGRGVMYRVGWKMRLYDSLLSDYTLDPVNTITSIVGDTIYFENDFITLLTTNFRIMFADYDDVTEQQKKYCFISNNGSNFSDGKKTYEVTY